MFHFNLGVTSAEHLAVEMALVQVHALRSALVHVDDLGVVESEQGENGGMKVVDVHLVLSGEEAEFVGGA